MSARDIERHYARTYKFRRRGAQETWDCYRAALVAHLEGRDWAAAEEVRIGRRQADWTPADVDAFRDRMVARERSTHPPRLPPHLLTIDGGRLDPLTDDALITFAGVGLDNYVQMRRRDPEKDLIPILTTFLFDGRVWMSQVSRGDRISTMKALARDFPIFGFALAFDAFMHAITVGQTATKRDVLMQHIVTRTCRRIRRRPYTVRQGRAIFDDPAPEDLDPRAPIPEFTGVDDPYADVFVSVPEPTGKPS